ncbi:MAG: hypothetical protein II814_07975 [Treponema sp.]|nr:hypothetical protein [Treponema sp.]
MADPMTGAQGFSDRDLIDFVIGSYFIVDYGFVKSVNDDDTVDVVHARKPALMDGEELGETLTKNLEVLTFSCAEFAVSFKAKKGDKVLLLALKDWVKSTADVEKAESQEAFIHYERETMKALPMAAFDSEAKVKIEVDGGDLSVTADGEYSFESKKKAKVKYGGEMEIEASDKGKLKVGGDLEVDAKSGTAKIDATKIELNGNSKQFVTWTELNTALQTLVSQLNSHTHKVPEPVNAPTGAILASLTIDISAAKTTTVVTGG